MNIAIIPARGGSKRIPQKNKKIFKGKPMITWAIHTAQKTNLFDKIIVSTDDEELANLANREGAITPFIRPKEISDDYTPTLPVIKHALNEIIANQPKINIVACIYPCTPFLKPDDLISGLNLLNDHDELFVYPVSEYPHPVQRSMIKLPDGRLKLTNPEFELNRTQDLQKHFFDLGQFYIGSFSAWQNNDKIHSNALGLELPYWRFVDIDTMEDWIRAEVMYDILELKG